MWYSEHFKFDKDEDQLLQQQQFLLEPYYSINIKTNHISVVYEKWQLKPGSPMKRLGLYSLNQDINSFICQV